MISNLNETFLRGDDVINSRRDFFRFVSSGAAAGIATSWRVKGAYAAFASEPAISDPNPNLIRLDSNENAYGPSAKVENVIKSASVIANRYPFRSYKGLIDKIAGAHHVQPEQVLLGCGSTEILRMASFAFLGPSKQLLQASPTFEMMEHYARSAGSEVITVPLDAGFAHDLDRMLARASASTTLVYICNPNNPTATLTPRQEIEKFIRRLPASAMVVIDEAYHHYAGQSGMYASFIDRPVDDERVIVTRTFSKVYGLAGLRLGYAVASPKVVQLMYRFAIDANINGIVTQAAAAALDEGEAINEFVRRNTDDRQEFFNQAMARAVKPIDSHANFVMMNTFHPAEEVIAHFDRNNILIGPRFPQMDTYIRVSLGRPEEMQAFWRAWDALPYPKHSMHH